MGVVYAARDDRLDRTVALKLLIGTDQEGAKERFWREAKLAAQLSHPNICQIYDVGEHEGQPYLAMELLTGQPLSSRIDQGSLPAAEALGIILATLDGLEALHGKGIVHRDLKPSNIFLSQSGVKLLDFGLARNLESADGDLTKPGTVLGTPRYMAPEQWGQETVTAAADLFAAGAVLFEMLSGRHAFPGDSVVEICKRITTEHPPALTGGPQIEAIDRVIHRALSKPPADRYSSASLMREALVAMDTSEDRTLEFTEIEVRAVTRMVVLPMRLLRPDEEIDFLAYSLSDAVIASLAGMQSLVVRAAPGNVGYTGSGPDLDALAEHGDVDAALSGTLLRGGDRVRLTTQLVEVPSGTVLDATTAEASMEDIFGLQDELVEKVMQSLAVPLGEQEDHQKRRDVPADGQAYEAYLRANDMVGRRQSRSVLRAARALYQESLKADPSFAPAWAKLGRTERLLAKYGHGDASMHRQLAESAFDRALEINPDLPLTHNLVTYFEIEEQKDPIGAMGRLLGRVAQTPDPNLYAGLVTACRFGGLYDASIEADRQAKRLDPQILTSIAYTHYMRGDYERSIETDIGSLPFVKFFTMARLGKSREAVTALERAGILDQEGLEATLAQLAHAAFQHRAEEACRLANVVLESDFQDPEGLYFVALHLAVVGELDQAATAFDRIVSNGFSCYLPLSTDPVLAELREHPGFDAVIEKARLGVEKAQWQFRTAGGESILGVQQRSSTSGSDRS